MDWSERMNSAIDYIEANLDGELDIGEAAKRAACSTFHFQRLFFAVNGLTPIEYTRRRRLTLAAREIIAGNRVIDIALKYGYDSPDAFTRAFRNLHGVTPTAAREPGVQLTAYPRIFFNIQLTGGTDMDYRIIDKPTFDVVVKSEKISGKVYEGYIIDPEAWEGFWWDYWERFYQEKRDENLFKLSGGKTGKITGAAYLGVTTIEEGMKRFTYATGIEKPNSPVSAGYETVRIPAAAWAVFESTGPVPKALHDLQDKVFIEWFIATGYEHSAKPELEIYLPGDRESENYRCQYWMPVVKK